MNYPIAEYNSIHLGRYLLPQRNKLFFHQGQQQLLVCSEHKYTGCAFHTSLFPYLPCSTSLPPDHRILPRSRIAPAHPTAPCHCTGLIISVNRSLLLAKCTITVLINLLRVFIMDTFGKRMATLLKERKMTYNELTKLLRTSISVIGR